eukprot:3830-Rhodomonas_salina.2
MDAVAPVRFSPAAVNTCSTYLVDSVLPDPDSPEIRMHWFLRCAIKSLLAPSPRPSEHERAGTHTYWLRPLPVCGCRHRCCKS